MSNIIILPERKRNITWRKDSYKGLHLTVKDEQGKTVGKALLDGETLYKFVMTHNKL